MLSFGLALNALSVGRHNGSSQTVAIIDRHQGMRQGSTFFIGFHWLDKEILLQLNSWRYLIKSEVIWGIGVAMPSDAFKRLPGHLY